MGEFILTLGDAPHARRIVIPNRLADEGLPHLFGRIFPPYGSPANYIIGVSGRDLSSPDERPEYGVTGIDSDRHLTFANVTDDFAHEGGGYTAEMRTSFGYARKNAEFTTATEAQGGAIASVNVQFPNSHAWSPQSADAWDNRDTPTHIEQPPPEWSKPCDLDPTVGFPYQRPRKLTEDVSSNTANRAYMWQWDSSGSLNWLGDLRKMGGFAITNAWVAAQTSPAAKLIAIADFRNPVNLWPGLSIHLRYTGRFWPRNAQTTPLFLRFMADRCFADTSPAAYEHYWAVPLLPSFPGPSLSMTFDSVYPHFAPLDWFVLTTWTHVPYSAGPPEVFPYHKTVAEPIWTNRTAAAVGPMSYVAVFGQRGSDRELCWVCPLPDPITLAPEESFRIKNGLRFYLEAL